MKTKGHIRKELENKINESYQTIMSSLQLLIRISDRSLVGGGKRPSLDNAQKGFVPHPFN